MSFDPGRRALLGLAALPAAGSAAMPAAPLLAYVESWLERPATTPGELRLASPPAGLDLMALAFARPEMRYAGGLSLAGTGLQFSAGGAVLRQGLALARRSRPGLRIILSVGGATYQSGWGQLDAGHVAALVTDFGLDGVDVDFEPADPGCGPGAEGRVRCRSDAALIGAVTALRAALPRPALLTVAGWSTGAYGEGAFRTAPPGGHWMGSMLALLRHPVAATIDAVNVMSYDAGASYRSEQAAAAYRAAWPGTLLLGVAVPGLHASRPHATLRHAAAIGAIARTIPPAGVFIYGLLGESLGPDGPALLAAASGGLRG